MVWGLLKFEDQRLEGQNGSVLLLIHPFEKGEKKKIKNILQMKWMLKYFQEMTKLKYQ